MPEARVRRRETNSSHAAPPRPHGSLAAKAVSLLSALFRRSEVCGTPDLPGIDSGHQTLLVMRYSYVVALLVAGFCTVEAEAQFGRAWTAPELEAGQTANIFVQWEGDAPVDGFSVRLPVSWQLQSATALRQGFMPVPVSAETIDTATNLYRVEASKALRGMHEIILTVTANGFPGLSGWSITPERRARKDGLVQFVPEEGLRFVQDVRMGNQIDPGGNHALEFRGNGPGYVLPLEELPGMSLRADFTVEGWVRTTTLDRVILSTWDGLHDSVYPAEVIVDTSGRLRYFRSEQGRHVSMASRTPIADGAWHHFAIAHDTRSNWSRLYLDGMVVDSLYSLAPDQNWGDTGLAIGHRLDASAEHNKELGRFVGLIDELRVWPRARTPAQIKRTMRQTLPANGDGVLILTFDEPFAPRIAAQLPDEVNRRESTLAFQTLAQGFEGTVSSDGIHLGWESADPHTVAFIVERSFDGHDYVKLAEIPGPAGLTGSRSVENSRFSFVDTEVGAQVVYYRLRQQFTGVTERVAGTIKLGLRLPEEPETILVGNFPNPFNPSTTITYEVLKPQHIRLTVWDLSGHRISVLVDTEQQEGTYTVPFDGEDLPSGTYFIRLQSIEGSLQSHKMVLMK